MIKKILRRYLGITDKAQWDAREEWEVRQGVLNLEKILKSYGSKSLIYGAKIRKLEEENKMLIKCFNDLDRKVDSTMVREEDMEILSEISHVAVEIIGASKD